MEVRKGLNRILVGNSEKKRTLGRHRNRWEDNNSMELQKVECGGMELIGMAYYRDRWRTLVNAVMNLLVP